MRPLWLVGVLTILKAGISVRVLPGLALVFFWTWGWADVFLSSSSFVGPWTCGLPLPLSTLGQSSLVLSYFSCCWKSDQHSAQARTLLQIRGKL